MKLYFIRFTDEANEGYYYKCRQQVNGKQTIITCLDIEDAFVLSSERSAVNIAKDLVVQYNAECVVEAYKCRLEEIIETFE